MIQLKINTTGLTEPKRRLLNIMNLVGEIFIVKKPKKETDRESEKFDIAQGGIDTKDMLPLEDEEEEEAKRQKRQGLKIMTPKQMIVRLPILLAQLKSDNIKKLKNEIRQIAYSRSKSLSKTIYNNLMNTI